MPSYTDIFNRADENPITGDWSIGDGAVQIASMLATSASPATLCTAFWSANAFPPDQFSEVSFASFGSPSYDGPAVRLSTGNGYYVIWSNSGVLYLYSLVSGVQTLLTSFGATVVASDVLRLEIAGSLLTAKVNGTVKGTATDSAVAAGAAGMAFYRVGTDAMVNYWSGGFSSAAPASPVVCIME